MKFSTARRKIPRQQIEYHTELARHYKKLQAELALISDLPGDMPWPEAARILQQRLETSPNAARLADPAVNKEGLLF